jgi:hypothetical protein
MNISIISSTLANDAPKGLPARIEESARLIEGSYSSNFTDRQMRMIWL